MPMYKKSMFVLLVLVILSAAGLFYGYSQQEEAVSLDEGQSSGASATIMVYVSGAVNRPGVVELAAGSRVVDAVNACGGLLPIADGKAMNMARVLKDGEQLQAPMKGASSASGSAPGSVSAPAGQISINTADEKALDSLPGIGPTMAKRIVEYRQANGSFQSLDELKKVKGIGTAKFDKLKDKVCL